MDKKKRTRIIAIVLAVFSCGLLLWFLYPYLWKKNGEEDDEYDEDIEFLNSQSLTLLVYGEKLPFRRALWYDRISEINEQVLNQDTDYVVLIINDRHGHAKIGRKRIDWIKAYAKEHDNFSYYYFGREKMGLFRPDMTEQELAVSDDISF